LISQPVITDYAENNVDTLHKKNLLSLGEDRYLTTLMLKHFPNMKISFTPDAICKTYAPDRWSILLSQRRRWINSTVHNLLELLLLPQLCGFCCFSMRFVVFFDLFSTLVMPATMGYLAYLIIEAINDKFFPLISLILLVAGYGLQIIIFLLKKKWEHIGWLIIYILALPFFTFFIPVYAFWHL
jgi:chitin synthase